MSKTDSHPRPESGAPNSAPRFSLFGQLTRALNLVGTLLILIMAIAVNADVLGRNLFSHPLPGVLEFTGWSIVAIVFLQMANTLRERRHVSNDILMSFIVVSHPRLVTAINAVFDMIGMILMAIIVYYMWPIVTENYTQGYFAGTAGLVEIPIWPFMTAILIGAIATAVQFGIDAWDDLRKFRHGKVGQP